MIKLSLDNTKFINVALLPVVMENNSSDFDGTMFIQLQICNRSDMKVLASATMTFDEFILFNGMVVSIVKSSFSLKREAKLIASKAVAVYEAIIEEAAKRISKEGGDGNEQ